MAGPVEDRLRLLRATRTHLSPVYGTIGGPDARRSTPCTRTAAATEPPCEMVDEQGVRHRMWPIAADAVDRASSPTERLLIADGHHRYTTALRYRDERRASDGARSVGSRADARGRRRPPSTCRCCRSIACSCSGRPAARGRPTRPGWRPPSRHLDDDAVPVATSRRRSDGAVAYRRAAARGRAARPCGPCTTSCSDDRAPDGSLRFVPDAPRRTRPCDAARPWPPTCCHPPRRTGSARVVERGERLPQKSTYFWPKPRTGMVMMPLDPTPDSSQIR